MQRQRKQATHYTTAEWDTVNCHLCPHQCSVAPSRPGQCGVRINRNGEFYLDTYGKVAYRDFKYSAELPLFHFHPNATWLLLGMKGCTMRCGFCNTSKYSLTGATTTEPFEPAELVKLAEKENATGIVFGINEPVVSHEFIMDTFKLSKSRGLRNVLLTNGSWMEDPFQEIMTVTDAFVFGLKGFDERRTTTQLGGHLEFILLNMEAALAQKKHVEIHYVVLGAKKEAEREAQELLSWVKEASPIIPIIVQRQVPSYLEKGETDPAVSKLIYDLLRNDLPYVYNLDNEESLLSKCRHCGEVTLTRSRQSSLVSFGYDLKCAGCGEKLDFNIS